MRPRTLLVALAATLVGLLAATSVHSMTAADPAVPTSTTAPAAVLAMWEAPAEFVLPPSVVVPTRMAYSDGVVEIDYDVLPMSVGGEGAARPTDWILVAAGREYRTTVDPFTSRVTFAVGFDFSLDTVEALRLERYYLWTPVQIAFRPAANDSSRHELAPGVYAALDLVQLQSSGAIVRVQLSADVAGATSDLAVEGTGPGWASASSNFGGGGLWTMSFEGDDLPDPIPLLVRGFVSIPLTTNLTTTAEAVPRG